MLQRYQYAILLCLSMEKTESDAVCSTEGVFLLIFFSNENDVHISRFTMFIICSPHIITLI